jgi:uncharacterized protein YndB with AHSA1/START domain
MTVLDVVPDRDAMTLTLTAEYDAPVERVWQLWADPRLLERWWGPPTYPATVRQHDLRPGGTVAYVMTGPDGDEAKGFWRVTAVDPPRSLAFDDLFGEPDAPATDLPVTRAEVTLTPTATGTRMIMVSSFPTAEALDQLVEMGMLEGLRQAVGQTDDLLLTGAR